LQIHHHAAQATMIEAKTLILRERRECHVSVCHCTIKESNMVKHSKAGQTVNSGQRLVKGGQTIGV